MIRREEGDAIWVIHQPAHAYISGRIAEHWTGSGDMVIAPREELLVAAYTHDAGWASAEQQPRLNAQGQPRTFTEMDLDEHFTIWQGSIEAVFAQNRYAALLTSLHCAALYDMRLRYIDDPPEDRARIHAFLKQRRAWQDALIAALSDHPQYGRAVQPEPLAENLRLLQVWDYLSLLLCMSPVNEQMLDDVPFHANLRRALYVAPDGARGMTLEPFPLDHPVTVWVDARQIVGGPFASHAAFRQVLAECPYEPLAFELKPVQQTASR